jgi:hypothetical protein
VSDLILKGEFVAGTERDSACGQACVLATKLDVTIEFDFNGVRCLAHPGASSSVLSENIVESMNSKLSHKFATAWRK